MCHRHIGIKGIKDLWFESKATFLLTCLCTELLVLVETISSLLINSRESEFISRNNDEIRRFYCTGMRKTETYGWVYDNFFLLVFVSSEYVKTRTSWSMPRWVIKILNIRANDTKTGSSLVRTSSGNALRKWAVASSEEKRDACKKNWSIFLAKHHTKMIMRNFCKKMMNLMCTNRMNNRMNMSIMTVNSW